jgi:Holliday junction DNA helicase RuvA
MFDYLTGTVKTVNEKTVTIDINGMGFLLSSPSTKNIIKGSQASLYTYFHWNQETGPTLFGFSTELERKVFLLIIDCPKIGPGIALNILTSMRAAQFLDVITTQNEKALSALNGIGEKKAEQIIVHLKHKVQKLIGTGAISIEHQESFVLWQNVTDVLTSLNYSKPEITKTMNFLVEKYTGQNCPLDQLIRSALAYLATTKQV